MPFTKFTNLDFDQIKTSIKDYLRANSDFTDFDFEGSNFSVLIDTLAYNTYITAFNSNMVANESFLDSATLRENVVSLARNIGYVPRSKTAAKATVSFTIDVSTTASQLILKAGLVCVGAVNNSAYTFSVPGDVSANIVNNQATFTDLEIYQGTYLTKEFIVDTSQDQRFILNNPNIDTTTIKVRIGTKEYKQVDNIITVDKESEIYLIQEVADEKYELLFGDGLLGKRLNNGQVVDVTYITTNGSTGNGVRNFAFAGTLIDNDGVDITSGISDIRTNIPSKNGAEVESLSSVKNLAPRFYAAQHRAVTALDYEAIIPQIYPNTESVVAYGGESSDPPQFGKVFISIKPNNGQFISDFDRRNLLDKLKQYSVAGIVPEFIDLKFLYVEINSSVYYNTNAISDSDSLKTTVINNLNTYAKSEDLNKFGGRFKYSKVQNVIDESSSAIVSNITKVKIRRNLEANLTNPSQYELCYGNAFHNRKTGYNIKSTGFRLDGVKEEVFMADQYISATRGRLFFFTVEPGREPNVIVKNAGTVKYDVGEILIDTVRFVATSLPEHQIEIEAIPDSNDVLGLQDLYVQLAVDKSTITPTIDAIASGSDNSGTSFVTTSSFSNGKYIRE